MLGKPLIMFLGNQVRLFFSQIIILLIIFQLMLLPHLEETYKVLLDNYLSLKGEIYFNHELQNINQDRNKFFLITTHIVWSYRRL